MAISSSNDRTLRLWDLEDRVEARRFAQQGGSVGSVAFSPNGKLVLTRAGPASPSGANAPEETALILWDVATGMEIRRLQEHTHAVRSIAFSADGGTVLSGAVDGTLIVWDVASGQAVRQFRAAQPGQSATVWSVALSPDGRTALSSGGTLAKKWLVVAGEAIVWDLMTGDAMRRFAGYTNAINSAVYTPDGRNLLVGLGTFGLPPHVALDSRLLLVDIQTGKVVRQFVGHTDYVVSVAISPDGQRALSSSFDGTIRLWDIATGQELRRFIGHESRVTSVGISPDGHTALSGSFDGSVSVWDIATGAQLRRFVVGSPVNSVAFSPDGQYALSGAEDGKLQLWRLSLDRHELISWTAMNRYVRDLSCTERELYGVDPACKR